MRSSVILGFISCLNSICVSCMCDIRRQGGELEVVHSGIAELDVDVSLVVDIAGW